MYRLFFIPSSINGHLGLISHSRIQGLCSLSSCLLFRTQNDGAPHNIKHCRKSLTIVIKYFYWVTHDSKNHISLARIVHMAPLNGVKNSKYVASRRWRFLVLFKVTQSSPTLCNHTDYTIHGILQARELEWVDFPFSRALPNSGTEPRPLPLQVDSLPAEPQGKPLWRVRSTCCLELPATISI